jgi:hypothetical protein
MKPTTLFFQKVHEEVENRRRGRYASYLDSNDPMELKNVDLSLLEISARQQT